MKKFGALALVLLLSVAGCAKKNKNVKAKGAKKAEIEKHVDIPLADDAISSFFDEGLGEFALEGELDVDGRKDGNDFAWVDGNGVNAFDVVYFDFDRYEVKDSEAAKVERDARLAAERLKAEADAGRQAYVVVEGHACHSAGSDAYNLALSEKRAKVLADRMTSAGIPRQAIKVVGRGSERPAIIDGKEVTGNRAEQAPNRRDEVNVVNS